MRAVDREYAPLWAAISQEYRSLRPELSALRAPGTNYLQIDTGGKAAHYEWKVLHAPRSHVEVALHFEGPRREDNQTALGRLQAKDAKIRAGISQPFVAGRWGSKWARFGFQVYLAEMSDQEVARESAQVMKDLIERTHPLVKDLLVDGAKTG